MTRDFEECENEMVQGLRREVTNEVSQAELSRDL
jgi:hypothetical protein